MSEVGIYNWQILPFLIHICEKETIRDLEGKWVELLNADLNVRLPRDTNNKWNDGGKNEYKRSHYHSNIERKKYYCDVCDKAFGYNRDLKRHLKTSKHFWKYIYSVD